MESVFEVVGSCGCFQVSHVICVQLVRLVAVWALHLMVFGSYEPPWRCVQYPKSANITLNSTLVTYNSPQTYACENFSQIQFERSTQSSTVSPHRSAFNLTDNNCNGTAISYPGTCSRLSLCDDILFDKTSVTVVSDFRLICDQNFIPSVIVAAQMIGMLFGCSLSGQYGELCGRKINIFTCLGVVSTSAFVAAWSTSWHMHAVLTFFIGFGAGGIIATHYVYAMEFLTPKWRGHSAAIPVGSICLIVFACVIFGLKNWRHMYMLCGGVGGIVLLGAFWVPESLRWLHTHGKEQQCKKVIKKIMVLNKRRGDVSEVLRNLNDNNEEQTKANRRYTYLDLFRSKSLCAMSIKVSIVWCSLQMCYITMSYGIKALSGNFYVNLFFMAASEIPFILPMSSLVNKIGRKFTVTIYICLTTICLGTSIITFYAFSSETSGPIIKYLAIMSKGSADVGMTAIAIFGVELFPTAVRNLAIGFFNTVARIGTIGSSLLIPRDQDSTIICFFVLVGGLLIGGILVLSLPETKDKPLTDTLKDSQKTSDISCDNESQV